MANEPVAGRLLDPDTGAALPGLLVEAWDTGGLARAPLGTAESDGDGGFRIELPDEVRRRLIARRLQVWFRVRRDGATVAETRDDVQWDPEAARPVDIPIRFGGPAPVDPYEVHGTVVTDRGTHVEGLRVEVWDRELTGERQLAVGSTGPDGTFRIPYDPGRLAGKQLADLQLRVLQDGDQRPTRLAESKITYQAPRSHEVDLVVPYGSLRPVAEHDALSAALTPLVADTPADRIGPDGVTFLANRGGFDPRAVAMTVQAARGAAATGIPAEHYYALFRSGAATDLTTAHQLTDARLRSAVESAIAAGVIPGSAPIDRTLEIHRDQARVAFRSYVPATGMSTLDDLLSIRLDENGKDLFIDQLRQTQEKPEQLWSGLAAAGMDDGVIKSLQLDGQLGHLTLQNAPLVRRLVEAQGVGDTRDLVRSGLYEPDAWLPLIGDDVPAGLTKPEYAAGLAAQVRLGHPQLVTADLVRRGEVQVAEPDRVAEFLAGADGRHQLGQQPMLTWSGLHDLDQPVRDGALAVERLWQITPSDSAMRTLSGLGIDSAHQVARLSEGEFVAGFGDKFRSPREATLVHRKAQQVTGTVLNAAVDFVRQRGGPAVWVLAGRERLQLGEDVPARATLETLFGNLDFCACEHCNSVLSPAAYFVDLLEMLDLTDLPHDGDDPQAVLFERRPDLANLLLTCENTNTEVPYVDLVNEVLEHWVANGTLAGYAGHDTDPAVPPADLLVDPQFVEAAAYPPLAAAVFPVPLPFSLPLAGLRLQFEAWDTTLAEALEVFGTPADARRETLGLSPAQLSVLTDSTFRALPEYFGEPAAATIDDLNAAVANAKVFARRVGISYLELDEITRTRFAGPLRLSPPADAAECDFGQLEVRRPDGTALTETDYIRLHRFVRLWRRLGRDLAGTDELLARVLPELPAEPTAAELDAATATALARVAGFQRVLATLAVPESRWDDWLDVLDPAADPDTRRATLARLLRIGTAELESLLALTGRDPLAADLDADEPSLLRFVADRRAAGSGPLRIADLDWLARHVDPAGTASVADPMRELRVLRDALAGVDQLLGAGATADPAVTQVTMALVYDPAVVARFFGLLGGSRSYAAPLATAEEALPDRLTAVAPGLGIDPFGKRLTHLGVLPTGTRDALHAAAGALTLAELDEIDTQPELDGYVAAVKAAVDALQAAGAADRDGFVAEFPELGAVLDAALATADPTTRAGIVRDGVLVDLRPRLKATAVRTALVGLLPAEEALVDLLVEHTGADLTGLEQPAPATGTAELWLDPQVTDEHVLYVQAAAGTTVGLSADGAEVIATGPVGAGGEATSAVPLALVVGTPVRLALTSDAPATLLWRTKGIAKAPVPADRLTLVAAADTAAAALVRLHKAAALTRALGLTQRELAYFAGTCPDTAGVLAALPTGGPAADVPALVATLLRLADFAAFRSATESAPDSWVELLAGGGLGTADGQAAAARIGSWRPADVTAAVEVVAPADPGTLTALAAVRRVLALADRTTQPVAGLRAWALPDPTVADLTALRAALRAQLDAAAWRATMQSVNDALRNARRDALVAYILGHARPAPEIDTADALYEHFLIDVEMDACMRTSRIRLALSTVQLFVTRVLLNLEDRVPPSSIRADHWQWMKRYRVWEANRKIFLYPENWLEPELRDGKSAFFTELESDLLKSDITPELAEDAFLGYLKKLDDVARLEIVGLHLQQGVPGRTEDDILHVFGRTNGKTRQYYHRRFEYGYWTPWVKIGLTIEGDSVFPAVWRNQLYLFWVTAVDKPRRGGQDTATATMANQVWQPRSEIDVELTLSWGEYYHGRWSSPKSTNMRKPLVLRGLSEFHPAELVLAGRTETPAGMSERLILSVVYVHKGDVKAYKVTFTSKNAAPLVREDDADLALLSLVEVFAQKLFWDRQAESTLDATSLDVPRADLTLRIGQPTGAWEEVVDETLLTKKDGEPGFNLRTVMHPVENQWEAPFVYADEHTTFLVRGDERVVNFNRFRSYVPLPLDPVVVTIPPLVQQVQVRDPRDPIWNPSWSELVHPNYKNVIGENTSFELDGVQFRALGMLR